MRLASSACACFPNKPNAETAPNLDIRPRHWLVALLIASLTHAALALALVHSSMPVTIAPQGVIIEFGGGGQPGAAGAAGSPGATALHSVASPTPGTLSAAAARPVAARAASPAVKADRLESMQPVSPTETVTARALPKPAPSPKTAPQPQTPPTAQPRHKPRPKPSSAEPRDRPKAERVRTENLDDTREPVRPRSKTVPPAEAKPPAQTTRPGRSSSAAASSTQANERASRGTTRDRSHAGDDQGGRPNGDTTGSGSGSGEGGSGGTTSASNYYGRLATWLARHKRYPRQARRLRQEGTVKVTFTISRSGRVLSKRVVESSGYELLDQEVQAMLERASPLPRIPASLGRSSLTITVPVAFALR